MTYSSRLDRRRVRERCDTCGRDVARSWLARHVASGCRVAPGRPPPEPKFWLDSSLRLRPFNTLARNGSYYGVRTLHPRKKRSWMPV